MAWSRRVGVLIAMGGLLALPGAFAANVPSVPVTIVVSGHGTVRFAEGRQLVCAAASCKRTIRVPAQSRLTLTESAANGWRFATWVGACGAASTCRFRVTHASRVVGAFEETGTRKHPTPLGHWAGIDVGWYLRVNSVTFDPTSHGDFDGIEPLPGSEYVIVNLSTLQTNHDGPRKLNPQFNQFGILGAHHDYLGQSGYPPQPWWPSSRTGEVESGNVQLQVAIADAGSALFYYHTEYSGTARLELGQSGDSRAGGRTYFALH